MDKGEKDALWIKDGCCVWSRLSWIRLLMERKGALNNLGARKAGLCREECLGSFPPCQEYTDNNGWKWCCQKSATGNAEKLRMKGPSCKLVRVRWRLLPSSHTVRKFKWWCYCLTISLYLTKISRHIELCNSVISQMRRYPPKLF